MAGNNRIANHTFHLNSTTITTGTEYIVSGQANEMNIFFNISSSGTFKAVIEGYDYDTNKWYLWDVYQIPSYTEYSSGITDATKAYNISIKGIDKIRVNILSLNGILNCNGKAVG